MLAFDCLAFSGLIILWLLEVQKNNVRRESQWEPDNLHLTRWVRLFAGIWQTVQIMFLMRLFPPNAVVFGFSLVFLGFYAL